MRLEISYKKIFSISAPIMLGSAVQNVVVLSDNVFLFHNSQADFEAIGLVGVFYLIVAAIGYGFSKGGQIMVARRMGEDRPEEVGRTFYAMLYFELALAGLLFYFLKEWSPEFLRLFVSSEVTLEKCLEYLDYRSWGVFFSYTGVAMIALYTGVARTSFIVVDTLILAAVNIVLNYGLIFGHFGLPAMGISGAGLASTLAEVVAFLVFLLYMLLDKKARPYRLFSLPKIDFAIIKQQQKIGTPVVAQAVVGLGAWFVFFSLIENLGNQELAVSNLIRTVYLILSIPCWGFSSGINTMVSHVIGAENPSRVGYAIWKTIKMNAMVTLALALPVVLFPKFFLFPLFGGDNMYLIDEAKPLFFILLFILLAFSVGSILFNGLAGTGATIYGLKIQFFCAVGYLLFIYLMVTYATHGLLWAWSAEIFYWIAISFLSWRYIISFRWKKIIF